MILTLLISMLHIVGPDLSMAVIQRPPETSSRTYRGSGFSVVVGASLVVKKRNPVPDAEVYSFKSAGGATLLSAYAGNHPTFGTDAPSSAERRKIKIGDLDATELTWTDRRGRFYGEILINLTGQTIWPVKLHFWYKGLSGSNQKTVRAIVSSTQQVVR